MSEPVSLAPSTTCGSLMTLASSSPEYPKGNMVRNSLSPDSTAPSRITSTGCLPLERDSCKTDGPDRVKAAGGGGRRHMSAQRYVKGVPKIVLPASSMARLG